MADSNMQDASREPDGSPLPRVYQEYYHLIEPPFTITPDPNFLFFSDCHRQTLDKIEYAIECRMGFVLLTGEVGTGKTTLCRALLDRWSTRAATVYVINPSVSGQELLAAILEDLGEKPEIDASKKSLMDRLNRRLLANSPSCPTLVIIDDAQTMTPETLEDLRLLSNLETDKQKLIQVILSGQPELSNLLDNRNLRQLKQRIVIHCRLAPLPAEETGSYVSQRLSVAGNQGQVRFSRTATKRLYQSSGGNPRQINKICDFALTAAYVQDASVIDSSHVKKALAELHDPDDGRCMNRFSFPALLSAAVLLILIFSVFLFLDPDIEFLQASVPGNAVILEKADLSPSSAKAKGADTIALSTGAEILGPFGPAGVEITKAETGTENTDHEKKPNGSFLTEQSTPAPPRQPCYTLQLGSYRSGQNASRGSAQLRKKGIPAQWQPTKDGKWFRVIAGQFEMTEQAAQYKTDHGLKDAMIIRLPVRAEE